MIKLPTPTVSELFEAGVHFGHTTSRWNPKMSSYIHCVSNKTYIIDLNKTLSLLKMAIKRVYDISKQNGKILFVGTKYQASQNVKESAERCGQHYVNYRWLGGMLTNWQTVKASIKNLESIEKLLSNSDDNMYTKKEILNLSKKKDKLLCDIGGIRNMGSTPDLVIVLDSNTDGNALKEAQKLGIDTIAIVDTNSDPDGITIPIPGNDDGIKSMKLFCDYFARASLSGMEVAMSSASQKDIQDKKLDKTHSSKGGKSDYTNDKKQNLSKNKDKNGDTFK